MARLPDGYKFVPDIDINGGELWGLLKDVTRESGDSGDYVSNGNPYVEDITLREEDISFMALGVRNRFDELVGYASTTIDARSGGQATVDCLVVRPDETEQGIAKALADEGLRQLDDQKVGAVSFEIFGQVSRILPYLILNKAFKYDEINNEYLRRRPALPQAAQVKPAAPLEMLEVFETDADREPIDADGMKVFRDAAAGLIQTCTEYVVANRILVRSFNHYTFDYAGRRISVSKDSLDGNKSWVLAEYDMAELVASSHGVVMVTEKQYEVRQDCGNEDPTQAVYMEQQEIRGEDGKMRPFTSLDRVRFTAARLDRVLALIGRLSPERLISDPV